MSTSPLPADQTAAQLLVRSLESQDVKFIFGIPGGKIMPTFDVLNDEGPRLIVCHHEQNAAFMAGAVGRLTGRPGVCLVTSGPGTGNLVTGAATATTEGDPLVAIGGSVALADTLKQTHQTLDSVAMMKPVTKYSVSINAPESAGEVVANAFRAAMAPRAGAAFIAFPQDVQRAKTGAVPPGLDALPPLGRRPPPSLLKDSSSEESRFAARHGGQRARRYKFDPSALGVVPDTRCWDLPGRWRYLARTAATLLRKDWAVSESTRRQAFGSCRRRCDRRL